MRTITALAALAIGCGGGNEEPPGSTADSRVLEGPFTGVRVGASPDLTGDGAPDVLVSAPGLDGSGAVYVFSGLSTGRVGADLADAVLDGVRPGDVGEGLAACGDTDGDGVSDLLVGAPYAEDGRGGAWLLSGPFDGTVDVSSGRFLVTEAEARAGWAVSCSGDVDGDGVYDLAVTAPDADGFGIATSAGHVSFLRGSAEGPTPIASLSTTFSDSHLGAEQSLLLADLDADGLDDAIVGAPGVGRIHLVFGPLQGTYDPNVSGATYTADELDETGTSVAAGDLDGDGHTDLLAGGPGFDGHRGRVGIVPGPIDAAGGEISEAGRFIDGQDRGERAGFSLAVGDLDGDGLDDLLAGAPGAVTSGPGGGVVYVLYGPATASGFWEADAVLVGEVAHGAFGWSVATTPDLDGDGGADVLVGAPYTDVDDRIGAGAAYLFGGALSGQLESTAATATFVF